MLPPAKLREPQMTFSEYTLENSPIIVRPECPACTAQMYLARIERRSRASIFAPSNVRGVSTSKEPWCSSNRRGAKSPLTSPSCRSCCSGSNRLDVRARKTLPLLIQLRTNRFTGNIDVMGDVWTGPSWQGDLHVAGLVGAAMCSAFECGSHDR